MTMKNFFRIFVLAMCVFAMPFAASAAKTENLTDKDVKQFVSAIEDVENFADELKKEGKDKALEAAVEPVEGDKAFTPYGNGVDLLKEKFPDDYKELNGIVGKHGFKTPEKWASSGDQVMHAYMAVKIEEQNPEAFKQIKEITPEMREKLPPQAIQQLERAQAMMKLVKSSPEQNRKVVKAHMKDIDAWLDRAAQKERAEALSKTEVKPVEVPKGKETLKSADKPAEKKAVE